MAVIATVQLSPQLQATLARMQTLTRRETQLTALRAGALPIQNAAKANAPVKTGTLRRSITSWEAEDGSLAIAVGSRGVPYARRIELGFVGVDSLGRHYNQAPRPYLRPALDSEAGAAVAEVERAVMALIGG